MSLTMEIIEPTGILDGTAAKTLHGAVRQALDTDAQVILVDCAAVTFIDSSGLGALVLALKMARAAGRRFCLCTINQQADMLFKLTDTHQVFDIYPDRTALETAISTDASR